MTNKEKIALADRVIEAVQVSRQEAQVLPVVGKLNRTQGINGFKKCLPGTPVFQRGDRYLLIMETLDGKASVEIPYHPEDLLKVMDIDPVQEATNSIR